MSDPMDATLSGHGPGDELEQVPSVEGASLMRLGGACAILYTAALIVALVLLGAVDLLDAEDADEVLPIMEDDRDAVLVAGWLFVVAPIALAVAGLGLFMAFRRAGSVMWVALLAFVGGTFLALLRNIVWLAMTYELAPAYADASEGGRETLAALGDTLISFGFVVGDQVGAVLVAGIGVALFSAAILRTNLAPGWLAWLGFAAALFAGWFTLLAPVADAFELVGFVGVVGFFVWLVALGVLLWRSPERVGG